MEKIHAKETEKSAVENELARLKIDAMNVEAHNLQLQQTLEACVKELKEKDQLIEKYTMEIRQRNDSIEKKMSVVDRLNRKCVTGTAAGSCCDRCNARAVAVVALHFVVSCAGVGRYERLTSGQVEENLGPLEATIKNLSKQINSKVEASEQLQREWLQDQTALVSLANDVDSKAEKVCRRDCWCRECRCRECRCRASSPQRVAWPRLLIECVWCACTSGHRHEQPVHTGDTEAAAAECCLRAAAC
jgi:hypothetical protein